MFASTRAGWARSGRVLSPCSDFAMSTLAIPSRPARQRQRQRQRQVTGAALAADSRDDYANAAPGRNRPGPAHATARLQRRRMRAAPAQVLPGLTIGNSSSSSAGSGDQRSASDGIIKFGRQLTVSEHIWTRRK